MESWFFWDECCKSENRILSSPKPNVLPKRFMSTIQQNTRKTQGIIYIDIFNMIIGFVVICFSERKNGLEL